MKPTLKGDKETDPGTRGSTRPSLRPAGQSMGAEEDVHEGEMPKKFSCCKTQGFPPTMWGVGGLL